MAVNMDEIQFKAYSLAIGGHNVLMTGQGGTGKSFVLREIARFLSENNKNVAVTCTTGIAATQFANLKACTLHHWAGLGDTRMRKEELYQLMIVDERYLEVRQRIMNCDTLIIDECSMLSKRLFEYVEYICKSIRGNGMCFGGIQVIMSGDFFQLPPVKKQLYGETGQYCFESPLFKEVITHHINFELLFRQTDPNLALAVYELERGNVSENVDKYLKSLQRPLNFKTPPIHLFARNLKKDLFNNDCIMNFPGSVQQYTSDDEGDIHYLNQILAPKKLALKTNCPVMLLANLSDTLVNGLIGTVYDFENNAVHVHFPSINQIVRIQKTVFTEFDPVTNKVLAKRVQFPLGLAFGITIHKSQGMTLGNIVIDCEDATIPGQLGVALGRGITGQSIQLLNYTKTSIKKHPPLVYNFSENIDNKEPLIDLSCCMTNSDAMPFNVHVECQESYIPFSQDSVESVESDTDSEPDDSFSCHKLIDNSTPDVHGILTEISHEYVGTPFHDTYNTFVGMVNCCPEHLDKWIESNEDRMNTFFNECLPCSDTVSVQTRNITKMLTQVNTYLQSEEYLQSCKTLLGKYESNNPDHQSMLTSICFFIQKSILKKLSENIQLIEPNEMKVPSGESSEGHGVIRYIGGYCIAKIKHKYVKSIKSSLFNPHSQAQLQTARSKVDLLSSLTTDFEQLSCSTDKPETLHATQRKQNLRQGLTNITDNAFNFFLSLSEKVQAHQTQSNLFEHGETLHHFVKVKLENDSDLESKWYSLFENLMGPVSLNSETGLHSLFIEVVGRFLNVSTSQFRKEFLLHIKREKGKSHRKKVMEKKVKTK